MLFKGSEWECLLSGTVVHRSHLQRFVWVKFNKGSSHAFLSSTELFFERYVDDIFISTNVLLTERIDMIFEQLYRAKDAPLVFLRNFYVLFSKLTRMKPSFMVLTAICISKLTVLMVSPLHVLFANIYMVKFEEKTFYCLTDKKPVIYA